MGYSLEKSSPLQKSIVVDIGGGGSKEQQHDKHISKSNSSLVVAISKSTSTNMLNNNTVSLSSNNDKQQQQHKHSPHKVHAPLLEQLASMAEKEVYSVERELGTSAFFNNNGGSTTTSSGGSTPSSSSNDSIVNNNCANLWASSSVHINGKQKKNEKKVEDIAKIDKKDDESSPRRLSMVTPSENGSHLSLVNAISSGDNGGSSNNRNDKDDTKVLNSEKDREEKIVINDSEVSSAHRKQQEEGLVKLQEEDKSSSSLGHKKEKEDGNTKQVNVTGKSSQKGINYHGSVLPSQPYAYHMHGPPPPGYHLYHPSQHQQYHPYQYYPYAYHAHQPLPSSMAVAVGEDMDVNDTRQKQSKSKEEDQEKIVEESSEHSSKKKLPLKKRKLGELTNDSTTKQEDDTSIHLKSSSEEKPSSDNKPEKKLKTDETKNTDEKHKNGYPYAYPPFYHHPYGGYYQQQGQFPQTATASPYPQILHSPHAYHQWSPSRHVAHPTTEESTPKISNRSSQRDSSVSSKVMSSCQASIQFQKVEKVTNVSSVKKKKHNLSPAKEGVDKDKEEKETKKKTPTLSLSQISTSIVSTKGRERCILMTTTAYRSIKETDTQAAATTDVIPPPLPPYQELVNYPQYLSDSKAGQKQQKMLALKNMTKNEHNEGGKEDSTRHCVMCGTCCAYATTNKKVQPSLQPKPSNSSSDEDTTSVSTGVNKISSTSSSPDTVTTKQQHYTYTIPRQNKGLCTSCDVKVWLYNDDTKPQVPIKWCKGCKNFRTWPLAFGSKVKATKCTKCRDKQRISYSSSKEKKAKK